MSTSKVREEYFSGIGWVDFKKVQHMQPGEERYVAPWALFKRGDRVLIHGDYTTTNKVCGTIKFPIRMEDDYISVRNFPNRRLGPGTYAGGVPTPIPVHKRGFFGMSFKQSKVRDVLEKYLHELDLDYLFNEFEVEDEKEDSLRLISTYNLETHRIVIHIFERRHQEPRIVVHSLVNLTIHKTIQLHTTLFGVFPKLVHNKNGEKLNRLIWETREYIKWRIRILQKGS